MVHPHPDLEGRVIDAHELQVGPFSASGWQLADKDGNPVADSALEADLDAAEQPGTQTPDGGKDAPDQQKPPANRQSKKE
jgi:hypothetical protein